MKSLGLDGYRKGWVGVWRDEKEHDLIFLCEIKKLLKLQYDAAAIDIPIGLPAIGNRQCDLEARERLGENRSRVFTGARRGLWDFASREDAHASLKSRSDSGVSCQLWCLQPKIKEVDDIMSVSLQRTVRETHPELIFLRLHSGGSLPNKKTMEGQKIRRDIVKRAGFTKIDYWLDSQRLGTGAKADDILDACAGAIAASSFSYRVPQHQPATDAKGLRMEIWY